MPLSEEEVRIAFPFAFRCEPREIDVGYHRTHPDFDTLRDVFINTDDFRTVNGLARQVRRPYAVELSIGAVISLPENDLYVGPGIVRGRWETAETHFVRRCLEPGAAMIDAGAMVGWFALVAADSVGRSGKVFAFEARADMARLVRRTIACNRLEDVIALHNIAVSDAPSEVTLAQSAPIG